MQEQTLFIEALEKEDPAERAAFLDGACANDPILRQRIEKLLERHQDGESFLESRAVAPATTIEAGAPAERPGTMIGAYKLLQQIGEGGMGVVWMAEQTQPVQRKVALKVIKPGMDSGQVIARFEAERQALAMMDHPNIAMVLDGGTTETGRPYFVMELVKGVPITKYCDERRLPPRARLELFIQVCQAVQHAHQKGIIHRDLKPSNVMVCLYDGKPVPKVIDFGVAKAAGPKLTEKTLFTELGQVVGTLEYMSPEQAELNQLDIDTRSDIYSLGVLLYELLTGTTPLERKRFKEVAFLEVLRLIREEESQKPSTRLSLTEGLPSIAANRGLEPKKLSGLVRGELDWIVMKSLDKDRDRRYETANGFAQDIQRYLTDEPVQACPPSASYRFRKFARRNKGGLVAATLGLAVLVSAAVGLAVSNALIQSEAAAKETALGAKLTAEKQRADEEQKRADAEGAKLRAESQRADEAQKRADAETQRAKALGKWRQTAHYLTLAQAFNEYRANKVARAEEMLDKSDEDLRHWEWHYLKRLCKSELSGVQLTAEKAIGQIVLSPDATRVAVQLNRLEMRVYDATTGNEVHKFRIQDHFPTQMVFSPDGKWLVICGNDKGPTTSIGVWNVLTGELISMLKGPDRAKGFNQVIGIAVSPDGQVIAATDRLGNLYAWERTTGKQLFQIVAHLPPATTEWFDTKVAFNHDGSLLVTAYEMDTVLKIWEVPTGKLVQSLTVGDGCSRAFFSPKGTWVAAAGKYMSVREKNRNVWVWEAKTGKMRHILQNQVQPVACLAFSPDEKRLATGSLDNTVTVWDVATGSAVATYRGHAARFGVVAVAFSTDGKHLISVDSDGVVKTRDATHDPEALALKCRGCYHAAFSPDGRHLAAAAYHASKEDWTGVVWDTVTGEEVDGFGTKNDEMLQLAYSPNGRSIAAAFADLGNNLGYVGIWDVAKAKFDQRLPGEKQEMIGPCFTLAYSPDGKLLAAGGADRLVHVWDTTTAAEKFRLTGHLRQLTSLAFSRDSRRLASATGGFSSSVNATGTNPLKLKDDNTKDPCDVRVWDMETGKELLALKWPTRPKGLALRPDGEVVAVTASDKTVRLFDVASGKELLVLRGHTAVPWAVAFSPDGKRLVTAGRSDQSVRLWDANTGEEILTFNNVATSVSGVAFSPDGHKIVATSQTDDVVKVWDATPLKK